MRMGRCAEMSPVSASRPAGAVTVVRAVSVQAAGPDGSASVKTTSTCLPRVSVRSAPTSVAVESGRVRSATCRPSSQAENGCVQATVSRALANVGADR